MGPGYQGLDSGYSQGVGALLPLFPFFSFFSPLSRDSFSPSKPDLFPLSPRLHGLFLFPPWGVGGRIPPSPSPPFGHTRIFQISRASAESRDSPAQAFGGDRQFPGSFPFSSPIFVSAVQGFCFCEQSVFFPGVGGVFRTLLLFILPVDPFSCDSPR